MYFATLTKDVAFPKSHPVVFEGGNNLDNLDRLSVQEIEPIGIVERHIAEMY